MERRLDDHIFIGTESQPNKAEESIGHKTNGHKESVHMPLCERIAYERAVKKGLIELQSSTTDSNGIDFVSLYNYATADWEK